ncbi:hypothetical protein PULV_b0466 [Pseudoalteromonas ulvae UL12]|uniref:polysaccharide deacetylase family protein n=1 Tax=Pseudoalteromonas ulvae TaxID=107327 RepID=UPI00186B7083|nr:polysaccharide deacetylase family protein [Pseudoalteromonas ulvae]MBE0365802.1 hypothetical protein [Pseudoalteromonas ulvae UL12]
MKLAVKTPHLFSACLLCLSQFMLGCGGSNSPSSQPTLPTQVSPPANIEVSGITYQPWTHSDLTVYVSDQRLASADNTTMLDLINNLTTLSDTFAVHRQPWLIHLHEQSPAIAVQAGYFYLPVNANDSAAEHTVQLISQLILNKRHSVNNNGQALTLADVLLSQAFASLIAQTQFDIENPYQNLTHNEADFIALHTVLSETAKQPFSPTSRWLVGDSQLNSGMGNALMQHAIKQAHIYYPGSDYISLSTLPLASFLPFVTHSAELPMPINEVTLRTPDISEYDQVPASEMHQLQLTHPTYYLHGLHDKKEVALSFDDGPSTHTAEVLEVLAKHQIQATFFVLGQNIQNRHPDILAIHQHGHLIGNHSYRHTDSSTISDHSLLWQNEIINTNDIIFNLVGYAPRLFRPPYGRIRSDQIEYLASRGMRTINWSIDTRDWHTQVVNQQDIEFAASHYSHPEAVILMHDGGGNRSNTVAALENIIQHYQNEGYRFVTLDTLLGIGRAR